MKNFFASTSFLAICTSIAFLLTLYCLLSAISAMDLPFVECNGHFSLDAPNVRCRRAVWLTYVFWLFGAIAFGLLSATIIRARHRRRERRDRPPGERFHVVGQAEKIRKA